MLSVIARKVSAGNAVTSEVVVLLSFASSSAPFSVQAAGTSVSLSAVVHLDTQAWIVNRSGPFTVLALRADGFRFRFGVVAALPPVSQSVSGCTGRTRRWFSRSSDVDIPTGSSTRAMRDALCHSTLRSVVQFHSS
mmetsp:Transcript_146544/g.380932  ORF Transcript_146544/g.380932 Transcript_146544/m.380932 type:complete len:136 (+) Transcript_146544:141-548(+)